MFWVIVLLPALAASLPSWRADESLALRVTLPGDMRHTIWIKQSCKGGRGGGKMEDCLGVNGRPVVPVDFQEE